MLTLLYLSHTIGRPSCCTDRREEHGCRGGGAIGAEFSWQPFLRAVSVFDDDDDDDEGAGESESMGQGPVLQWFPLAAAVGLDKGCSGAMAPWGMSAAAACSASRVGDEGGDGRSFFLLDNSFNRPFFSLWNTKRVCELKTERQETEAEMFSCMGVGGWGVGDDFTYQTLTHFFPLTVSGSKSVLNVVKSQHCKHSLTRLIFILQYYPPSTWLVRRSNVLEAKMIVVSKKIVIHLLAEEKKAACWKVNVWADPN